MAPQQQPMAQNFMQAPPQQPDMSEEQQEQGDIIGVIKIKDGIFICDEFGAQVSLYSYNLYSS